MAWYLTQSVYPISDDAANNRRLYRTDVYLNASGYNAYSGYSTSGGGSLAGQGFSFTGPSAASLNNSSQVIHTFDAWVNGDINGYYGTVGADAWFQGSGGYSPPYITASASTGGFNWDRKPAAVTGASAVVNANKSVTVSFSGGASPGGSPALSSTYHVSFSKAGGPATGDYTGSGSPITVPSSALQPGFNYTFTVWATNGSNDGASASSTSGSVFVPSGGKVWNGSAYVPSVTAKIYNGTAYVPIVTAKMYNGTAWVNLS